MAPRWVQDLVNKHHGFNLRFITEKTIEKSDLSKQQNRLLIPRDSVASRIVPMLDDCEKVAANLKKAEDEEGHGSKSTKKKGLPITLYNRAGWRFSSDLVHWDSSSGTIIRGDEWMVFTTLSGLKEKDQVEMWGFRHREGKRRIAFVIAKKLDG